jgi:hypothetical protein
MSTLATIIQELIALLSNANLAGALSTAASIATQILALLGNKNAERDIQSQDAYNAALLGSVSAAQWLYHNSQGNGMPHEDIVDGQFYWAKLATAGWTVVNGTVVAPSAPQPPVQ